MALIKCKHCGGLLSTRAARCPHCGAPVSKEPQQPVEAPPVTAVDKPQPAPEPVNNEPQPVSEPAVNDAPVYDEEESHAARNVTLLVLFLLLVAAGGYYFHLKSDSQSDDAVESWLENENFADTDSLQMDTAQVAEASAAEPEETLEAFWRNRSRSNQLLARYRCGNLQRDYFWNPDNFQLSIYDENGTCLNRIKLSEEYGNNFIDGDWNGEEMKPVTKLYNHHVYFVGIGASSSNLAYYTIFYLTPQEGNGVHFLDMGYGENGYRFQKSSVRLRPRPESGNEADFDYDVDETWTTIPLQ